jgi:hypothetical protein
VASEHVRALRHGESVLEPRGERDGDGGGEGGRVGPLFDDGPDDLLEDGGIAAVGAVVEGGVLVVPRDLADPVPATPVGSGRAVGVGADADASHHPRCSVATWKS